jgi:hypothetical protein
VAVPQITLAALAEVRRLVAGSNGSRPVVHVGWEAAQIDNMRGPNGETVWTRLSEGKWTVFVLDYDDPDFPRVKEERERTIRVHDLEFCDIFLDRYGRPLREPLLDFERDSFVLRDTAI